MRLEEPGGEPVGVLLLFVSPTETYPENHGLMLFRQKGAGEGKVIGERVQRGTYFSSCVILSPKCFGCGSLRTFEINCVRFI